MTANNTESESVTEGETVHYHGQEVTITVEVEDKEEWDDKEAAEIAIAALEHGLNTDYVSWDENHGEPTRGNRVI